MTPKNSGHSLWASLYRRGPTWTRWPPCWRSDWLTQGAGRTRHSKRRSVDAVTGRYAVAVTNATSALHIACLGSRPSPPATAYGPSPNTFVAFGQLRHDIGGGGRRLRRHRSVDAGAWMLLRWRRSSTPPTPPATLPKVVIPVAFAGRSCDMRTIAQLAAPIRFHGDRGRIARGGARATRGRPVGCGDFAHIDRVQLPSGQDRNDRRGVARVLTNAARLRDRLVSPAQSRHHGAMRSTWRGTERRSVGTTRCSNWASTIA